jgi:predicted O-methyltransferase YrrM
MITEGYVPDATEIAFIESISPIPDAVVLAMEAEGAEGGVPIVDRPAGRLLATLAHGRRRIVEVGTAIGYSTLWLARGMEPDGVIATIDPDTDRTARARSWWRRAGVPDERIVVVSEPALDAFAADRPELRGPFDLAFIDAIKVEYVAYVEALIPRLAPGALVVADNVLYGGLVAGREGSREGTPGNLRAADGLRAFDAAILADPRFRGSILPMCDGLLVAVYLGEPG